jgi:hypothetical protein
VIFVSWKILGCYTTIRALRTYPADGITDAKQDKCSFSAVRNCLEAVQHICSQVPDFSHFKIEALHVGDVPVPQVSEYLASYNHIDVVKSTSLIPESWLFIVVIVLTIYHFFVLPACRFGSMTLPMLHVACRPF